MLQHATVVFVALGLLTSCAHYRDSQVLGTWHVPYEAGVTARITFKADHTFDFYYKKGRTIDRISGPWHILGDQLWTRFPRIGWNGDQICSVREDEIEILEGGDNYVTYTRIR
jgi:hypothetical protein